MNKDNGLFSEADIVSTYTIDQAEEDGILMNLAKVKPEWGQMFSHITSNLLNRGYLDAYCKTGDEPPTETINVPNLQDLLTQAFYIVKNQSKNFTEPDYFYSGMVEFPDGDRGTIYITENELGKLTLMLPEDY